MFPKKNRADKNIIKKIFKEGRFINSDNISFKFFLDKNFSMPHISFVVPKKVAKSAVMRNRLRRLGYSVLNKYLSKFPDNFNGVFLFNNKSIKLFNDKNQKPHQTLEDDIKIILSKLKII